MSEQVSPEFRQVLIESARLLMQNRPGEAEEKLLPLYQTDPENADVLINLSGAYVLQRKWNKAVRLLSKAVKVHPNNTQLWMNLGAAESGPLPVSGPQQQERAIAAYQMVLRHDPHAPNVHYHLGLIYKERGEFNRASAFFQRALEVNPNDRDARMWLDKVGQMQANAGQTNGASAEAGGNNDSATPSED